MVKILFTKKVVDHILKQRKKECGEETLTQILIVDACKKGWSMGETFPFEIGKISNAEAIEDADLIQINSADIPDYLKIFTEKTILKDLDFYDEDYPLIIDFIENRDVSLLFIPVIPLPLEEYEFCNPKSDELSV